MVLTALQQVKFCIIVVFIMECRQLSLKSGCYFSCYLGKLMFLKNLNDGMDGGSCYEYNQGKGYFDYLKYGKNS